uniref:Uncharacterized protein n=1 Tax=viral metagenome TaxID=1070528 RepID=A0A6C0H6B7_9ZZZZ
MNVPTILFFDLDIKIHDSFETMKIQYKPKMSIPTETSDFVFFTSFTKLDKQVIQKVNNIDLIFRQFFEKNLFYLLLGNIQPNKNVIDAVKFIDENKNKIYKPDLFLEIEQKFDILKNEQQPIIINNIQIITQLLFNPGNYLYISDDNIYTILNYSFEMNHQITPPIINITFENQSIKIGGATTDDIDNLIKNLNDNVTKNKYTTDEKKFIETINNLKNNKEDLKSRPIFNYIYSNYQTNNVAKIKVFLEVVKGKVSKNKINCISDKKYIDSFLKPKPLYTQNEFLYEPKKNNQHFPSSYFGYQSNSLDEKYRYNPEFEQKLVDYNYQKDEILFSMINYCKIIINEVFFNCIKLYKSIDNNQELISFFVFKINSKKDYPYSQDFNFIFNNPDYIDKFNQQKNNAEFIKIYFLYKYFFKYYENDFNISITNIDDIDTLLANGINTFFDNHLKSEKNNRSYLSTITIKDYYLFKTSEFIKEQKQQQEQIKQEQEQKKQQQEQKKQQIQQNINKINSIIDILNTNHNDKIKSLNSFDHNLDTFITFSHDYIYNNLITDDDNDHLLIYKRDENVINNLLYIYIQTYYYGINTYSYKKKYINNNCKKIVYNNGDDIGEINIKICDTLLFPNIDILINNFLNINFNYFNFPANKYNEPTFQSFLSNIDKLYEISGKKSKKGIILLIIKKYYKINDLNYSVDFYNTNVKDNNIIKPDDVSYYQNIFNSIISGGGGKKHSKKNKKKQKKIKIKTRKFINLLLNL